MGNALDFASDNAHVVIPTSASQALSTGAFTFAAWVYPTSLASNACSTIIQRSNTAGRWMDWQLYACADDAPNPGRSVFRVDWNNNTSNDTGDQVQGGANLTLNQWTHVACTCDGTSMKFYLNGTLSGTTTQGGAAVPNSGKAIWIGANDVWGEPFRGRIDEVRLYKRALSDAEVQALAAP